MLNQNAMWDVIKDTPLMKACGMQKAEWDALSCSFDGAEDKERVQAHMRENPAHAQLVFAAFGRMGLGFCIIGDIENLLEIGQDMALMQNWAREVGLNLKPVTEATA